MTLETTLRLSPAFMTIVTELARRAGTSLEDLLCAWLEDRARIEEEAKAPTFPLRDQAGDGSHYRKPDAIDTIADRLAGRADVSVRRMVVGSCLEARARGLRVVVTCEGGKFLVAEAHQPPDYTLTSVDDVVAAVSFLLADATLADLPLSVGCSTPTRGSNTP